MQNRKVGDTTQEAPQRADLPRQHTKAATSNCTTEAWRGKRGQDTPQGTANREGPPWTAGALVVKVGDHYAGPYELRPGTAGI